MEQPRLSCAIRMCFGIERESIYRCFNSEHCGCGCNPVELTVDSAVTVKALIDLADGLKKDART